MGWQFSYKSTCKILACRYLKNWLVYYLYSVYASWISLLMLQNDPRTAFLNNYIYLIDAGKRSHFLLSLFINLYTCCHFFTFQLWHKILSHLRKRRPLLNCFRFIIERRNLCLDFWHEALSFVIFQAVCSTAFFISLVNPGNVRVCVHLRNTVYVFALL